MCISNVYFFRKIGFAYIVKFILASNGILDPSINGCCDFGKNAALFVGVEWRKSGLR